MQQRDFRPIGPEISKIQGNIFYDNVRAICVFQKSKRASFNAISFPLRSLFLRMI